MIARRREGRRLRGLLHAAARLSAVDDLTGLWNRRYALPQLALMAETAVAGGTGLAVMILDIDRFKSVNDRYGHHCGDAVLTGVARRLRDILTTDAGQPPLIARIGGEEFLVALPCPTAQDARHRAEALCDGIRNHAVQAGDLPPITVTISVGLAMLAGSEAVTETLDRADRALLAAKARGRNRVTLAQNVADAPPVRPNPMSQDELLGLFSADTVGRDVVLEPATVADMMGRDIVAKPSLEVIYDEA